MHIKPSYGIEIILTENGYIRIAQNDGTKEHAIFLTYDQLVKLTAFSIGHKEDIQKNWNGGILVE